MKYIFLLISTILVIESAAQNTQVALPVYTITGKELNAVDDRIFGAFFEKASWDCEIGSDAAISLKTHEVFGEVKDYMRWMKIPILRFPGGTAIDYYPWYYLIDSMPGKHAYRPANRNYRDLKSAVNISSDGRMGLHEYIQLCKELDIEPHLVVNLGDAYYKKLPIGQAALELGANLVYYCNQQKGKWADLRALNGSKEPFNVKYFQIGNETWLFDEFQYKQRSAEELLHFTNCVEAYARVMKQADPSIELIIDGAEGLGVEVMKRCGKLIAFNTFHSYAPWGIQEIKKENRVLAENEYSAREVWQALATVPQIDSASGFSVIRNWVIDSITSPLAITEWNINCWFQDKAKSAKPYNELLAYGIGAGSYLNAILRVSDKVKLANQSMLVGTGWKITGIRVDTNELSRPTMYPTAMVTGLYSREHGSQLMEFTTKNPHIYNQALTLNGLGSGLGSAFNVAEQDIVVTANAQFYFVHIVNRSFDSDREIKIQFPQKVQSNYIHHCISDRTKGVLSEFANYDQTLFKNASKNVILIVPSKSVSVFKFKK